VEDLVYKTLALTLLETEDLVVVLLIHQLLEQEQPGKVITVGRPQFKVQVRQVLVAVVVAHLQQAELDLVLPEVSVVREMFLR
jgi:hypothetical protein